MLKRCMFYAFDGYFCHFYTEDGKKFAGERSEFFVGRKKILCVRYEVRTEDGQEILEAGDNFKDGFKMLGYELMNEEDASAYISSNISGSSK